MNGVACSLSLLVVLPLIACPADASTPHPPIYIGGSLDTLPDPISHSGIRSGTGSAADPFVISDWEIVPDGSQDYAIYIEWPAAFRLENITVRSTEFRVGIALFPLSGVLRDIVLDGPWQGCISVASAPIEIVNLDATCGTNGVYSSRADLKISHSQIHALEEGITVGDAGLDLQQSTVQVTGPRSPENVTTAIFLMQRVTASKFLIQESDLSGASICVAASLSISPTRFLVVDADLHDCGIGILADGGASGGPTVRDSRIWNNRRGGHAAFSDLTFERTTFSSNEIAVSAYGERGSIAASDSLFIRNDLLAQTRNGAAISINDSWWDESSTEGKNVELGSLDSSLRPPGAQSRESPAVTSPLLALAILVLGLVRRGREDATEPVKLGAEK